MKRLLLALALVCLSTQLTFAGTVTPQGAECVSATGAAGAQVTCTTPTLEAVVSNYLTGFTVICAPSSVSVTIASPTIAGLQDNGTKPSFYLQETTTAVSFVAEDFTYPINSPPSNASCTGSGAPNSCCTGLATGTCGFIVLTMPAVTNGGTCSCVLCFSEF